MYYAKVRGEHVGKMFETREEAVEYNGHEYLVYPVMYPTEWMKLGEEKNVMKIDKASFVKVDGDYKQCFIIGIDVDYPEENPVKKN